MAVVDFAHKILTLKVVYYGCALGGKTTNLATLYRLTDPSGSHSLVSIATKDDRTLFFDLLPFDLGKVGVLDVRAKVYTVPGQVHYELTRRQVLAGADGVVLVVDSSPQTETVKANAWAAENLRFNLKAEGIDPDQMPIVLQWNKRDLPDARPLAALEAELNPRRLPSAAASAVSGAGVVTTFAAVLKGALRRALAKSGRSDVPSTEEQARIVDAALAEARRREPELATSNPAPLTCRVDMEQYRDSWAEQGVDRRIMDQQALLGEAVRSGMALAERIDDLQQTRVAGERRGAMLEALGKLAAALLEPQAPAVPPGLIAGLLRAGERAAGSLLLFRPGESVMEEREVVPAGRDLLNGVIAPAVGSAAHRLSQGTRSRMVEDLGIEVFFNATPPEARAVRSALIVPVGCDELAFGSIAVYGQTAERPFEPAETGYWSAAAVLLALSIQRHVLRRKLAAVEHAASSPTASGR